MSFNERIKERAKSKRMKIVLPESMDDRVLKAAEIASFEEIADIIMIAEDKVIQEVKSKYKFDKVTFIDPNNSELTEQFIQKLYDLRKEKGMTLEEAKKLLLTDYMYYACMLVKTGMADGVVSGACHSTSNTLRPALQIIKTKENVPLVSAFFLMECTDETIGDHGTLVFADSGLVEYPTSDELSDIAGMSADSFKYLVQDEPLVAMLSYSTMGSAKSEYTDKVIEATRLAKEKYPMFKIDGELQLDAAIVPEVASRKASNSPVAGRANVLVFPNLDAGNIGYKLVERFAHAKAYGPITQGMAKPVNDLSRGSSVDEIVGVVAITAVQAQKNN